MSFTSFAFLIFVFVVFPLLAVVGERWRVGVLVLASYAFYSAAYPPWLLILLAVTFADFHLARVLDRSQSVPRRRLIVLASCALNLGLLAIYKYAGFLAVTINGCLPLLGLTVELPVYAPSLPLGISFFVFESLSYIVDVYRRHMPPADRLSDYALFIAFFPHLVAGPIVRASAFLPQLRAFSRFRAPMWFPGSSSSASGSSRRSSWPTISRRWSTKLSPIPLGFTAVPCGWPRPSSAYRSTATSVATRILPVGWRG